MIDLSVAELKQISEHFQSCWPNEGVCFITTEGLLFPRNIHPSPTTNFKIEPKIYAEQINKLKAIVHSHPSTYGELDPRTPSPSDINNQIQTGVPWGIASTTASTTSEILWWPTSKDHELWGRPFIPGVFDCYTFIQAWYWQKMKITIPEKPYGHNWTDPESSFISDNMCLGKFKQIPKEQAKWGDLLTFRKATNNISHFGIYTGTDRMAHHARGRYSNHERFRKYRPFIYKVYTHE